jgi:cell division protein ZipA
MDVDTLRLILIIIGSLLLIGLYVWERRRARGDDEESSEDEIPDLDEDDNEPHLGAWHGEEDEEASGMTGGGMQGGRPPYRAPEEPELHLEPSASPPEERAPEHPQSPLILSFHITPMEGQETFDGEAIVHAASHCGVEPGEMDVFHRFPEDPDAPRRPLFSMANMVKPGTFPFGAMADFESPGLTLFSQAEGASNDPARLETMLETAHCLADELKGEIRDETRSPLTPEKEELLRDRVLKLVAWRLSDTDEE